jgi:hypothetical protein
LPLEIIPPGARGTKQTLIRMTELAAKAGRDWSFIKSMSKLVHDLPARNAKMEMDRLLNFVKHQVRYQKDPLTALQGYVELVQAPAQTLLRGAGDCDDQSTLIAAAALALGYRPRFVVLKADASRPDEFTHVYAEVFFGNQWWGMDSVVPRSFVGWEPPARFGRGYWRI